MDALCIVDVIVTAGPLPVLVAVVSQFDCDCNPGGAIAGPPPRCSKLYETACAPAMKTKLPLPQPNCTSGRRETIAAHAASAGGL